MSGGIGVSAPTDPVQAFAADIANLRQRIGDLERAAGRAKPTSAQSSTIVAGVSQAQLPATLHWVPLSNFAAVTFSVRNRYVMPSSGTIEFRAYAGNGNPTFNDAHNEDASIVIEVFPR
jgi:hypothetical protein